MPGELRDFLAPQVGDLHLCSSLVGSFLSRGWDLCPGALPDLLVTCSDRPPVCPSSTALSGLAGPGGVSQLWGSFLSRSWRQSERLSFHPGWL